MPSQPFFPSKIFIDRAVEGLAATEQILNKFKNIPSEIISDAKQLKKPQGFTQAKKALFLTRLKSDPLKEFHAMTESSSKPYYALNLISNCHLECTYCILQSYLANNPLITVFTNLEEIFTRLTTQLGQIPRGSVIGTGKIADSLALDPLTEHTKSLVDFFSKQEDHLLELKTKADTVENLIGLDHRQKTVVSWSMNPEEIIAREEFKTANFKERLDAAVKVVAAGYPVGFHFDPIILHKNWKKNYTKAIGDLFEKISPQSIAWVSVGALRFPAKQRRIIQTRFPKNKALFNQLISTHHSFLHYPDTARQSLQGFVEETIRQFLPPEKIYRCMDF